jgi:hypothetical protein
MPLETLTVRSHTIPGSVVSRVRVNGGDGA